MKVFKKTLGMLTAFTMLCSGAFATSAYASDTQNTTQQTTNSNPSILFSDNFDSYDENDGESVLETKGWDVKETTQSDIKNTVTVATDSVTNSKALKFYIANTSGGSTFAKALLPSNATGIIKLSYDFRAENNSRRISALGTIVGSDNKAFSMYANGAGIYSNLNGSADTAGYICAVDATYSHFDVIYNTDTQQSKVYVNGVLKKELSGTATDVSGVNFAFTHNAVGWDGKDNDNTETNAGVYWVDNVSVRRIEKDILFNDDFEDYSEGSTLDSVYCWDTTANTTGNSIVVATDEKTNSKALKFTMASDSTSSFHANAVLQTVATGKLKLSFDFRAQNDTKKFSSLGKIIGTDNKSFGMHTASAGFYYFQSASLASGYYIGGLDYTNRNYTHFDIIYDTTAKSGAIYINGKYKNTYEGAVTDVKNIAFEVGYHTTVSSQNGKDSTGDAVYWIDNLSLTQLDDNYFADDFESYSENSTLDSVYCWDTNADGNSIVVATDPKTQSKALKFTMASDSTSAFHANAVLPTVVTGKINVSFDFRAENDTKKFSSLGKIVGTGGDFGMHTASGNFYYFKSASLASDYFLGTLDLTDRNYTHFDIIYDTTAKSGDIYIDGKYKKTYEGTVTDVKNIAFEFGYNAYQKGKDTTGDAVYWIDNLVVKKASLGVISTTPENNAELASPSEISVKFNGPVSYNGETDANMIKIYENDTQITSGYAVSVDSNDSKVLNIAFDGKLNGKKNYKITVGKLSSTDTGFADMENEYTFQFKTLGKDVEVKYLYNNSDIEKISDVQGQTVTVRVTVDTEKITDEYTAFVALKNEKGQLKAIDMKNKPETDGYVELSLAIDSDATDEWDIECFVWKKDTLQPLTASVESFKKK